MDESIYSYTFRSGSKCVTLKFLPFGGRFIQTGVEYSKGRLHSSWICNLIWIHKPGSADFIDLYFLLFCVLISPLSWDHT